MDLEVIGKAISTQSLASLSPSSAPERISSVDKAAQTPPSTAATERFNAVMNASETVDPRLVDGGMAKLAAAWNAVDPNTTTQPAVANIPDGEGKSASGQNSESNQQNRQAQTLGDVIWEEIHKVSEDFRANKEVIQNLLNARESLQVRDLLKLQVELMKLSFKDDLVGKVIGKITQELDQLVRIQ